MAYLDPTGKNVSAVADAVTGVSDQLSGAAGLTSFPAAAAPANGISLAEVMRAVYNLVVPVVATGTIAITDASQTESTPFAILTIAPAAGAPLADVEVWIDLAKATTGFGAVETSITVQLAVARKVDGTNWRREAYQEAALSGTNAALRMARINVGAVGVTEQARIEAVFSADVTSNLSLPYAAAYRGMAAPTLS